MFQAPAPAAQNRFLTDVNLRIRKDGLAFIVGTGYTPDATDAHIRDVLALTVLNSNPLDVVNADLYKDDIPVKYPSLAFSPVDGTGYIVWRTKHPNPEGHGFEAFLRVIPPTYNGTSNTALGEQVRLFERTGVWLDQPSVAVDSRGFVYIAGYGVTNPARLLLLTLDPSLHLVGSPLYLDAHPLGVRADMIPLLVIDRADNIHVVAVIGTSDTATGLFAYSRVGAPNSDFVKTEITPPNWYPNIRGRRSKDLAVAPNGDVYAVINNTGAYDLYKRSAGPGGSEKWARIHPNLFNKIYNSSVAVGTAPDGSVWAVQGDGKDAAADPAPLTGTNVRVSTDGGQTFSALERAIPQAAYANLSVAVDGNGPGGRVYLYGSFQFDYDAVAGAFTSAPVTGAVQPPVVTPPPPPPAPLLAAPSNLLVTVLGPTQVRLTWRDNSTSETGFALERDQSGQPLKEIARTAPNAGSYIDSNLTPATSYGYQVRAFDGAGHFSGYTTKIIVKTAALPAPPAPPPPAPTPPVPPGPKPAQDPLPVPGPVPPYIPVPTSDPNIVMLNGFPLGHGFKTFFEKNGGVLVFGLPLSPEFSPPGTSLVKQVFERYVLTYNKNEPNPDWQITGEDIGRQWLRLHPLP